MSQRQVEAIHTLPVSYTSDIDGLVIRSGRHHLVVAPAPGRPIEPVSAGAIAGKTHNAIWVAYPSQQSADQPVHLVIAIVDVKRNRIISPWLISEPLTHAVTNRELDRARSLADPITELQLGIHFISEK